ncbi:Potassium voltage-gated channel subfamily G member 2 [Nibea albiflora]|uniref:Potassium voltage-gated channel subfamily G member 2 n=1 Tax=Nibea albiflora TaxID=240163 RepID=A0ACB7EG80_NIBAL|nr:Potassium voltage-gated channel subfamily G member 2 [Nibea albiflora]
MPIISNANHDFSTYSVSSDDSSLDRFFTEIPETETIKGVYFQRAQLLRDPKASYVVDHTLQVLINVGGNRYTFPWSTLEQFPQSPLLLCPQGECSQKCQSMFVVESICVAWFTLEFVLRFVNAQSKLAFARGPLNIIDAIAILPYYVSLVVDVRDEAHDDVIIGAGRGYLDKLSLILRLLRALRILYVMRLARHSLGLQTLGLTMQRSMREFGLLLLFVCVAVALFSPLVHLAESELAPLAATHPHHSFSSIPASYWWAIISMTTVGYGDMVPRSIPGQIVALTSILSGILIMAFPATSIFHTFSRSYQELKQEYERLWKEEQGEEVAAELEESLSKVELSPHELTAPSKEDDGLMFEQESSIHASMYGFLTEREESSRTFSFNN